MSEVDISGLDKGEVLAALYNRSHPQGLGFLHFDSEPMTGEEARRILAQSTYVDYLKGRVIKVNFGGNTINTWAYNRDVGKDVAEEVISRFRQEGRNCGNHV